MSWPVIAFAVAVLIFVVALVAWIALTADRHGSRHRVQSRPQPRPARGRHQGAHARRLRLWRHGDHGVPV